MIETIQAFIDIDPTSIRLGEIVDCQKAMNCISNEYDNVLTKIINDENTRLFKASQIISNLQ